MDHISIQVFRAHLYAPPVVSLPGGPEVDFVDRANHEQMDDVTAKLIDLVSEAVARIEGGTPAAQIAKGWPDDLLIALQLLNRMVPLSMRGEDAADRKYLDAGAPYYDEMMRLTAAIEKEMLRRRLKPVDEVVFTDGDGTVIGGYLNPRKPNRS